MFWLGPASNVFVHSVFGGGFINEPRQYPTHCNCLHILSFLQKVMRLSSQAIYFQLDPLNP